MKTLNRKLLRDLMRSKWLLLAITSIIAVGVMCFVSMQSAYHNLDRAKQRYYRQCRMADFWIELKKVPETELAAVGRLPGVSEIHARIQFLGIVDLPDISQPVNALVLSLPDRPQGVINDIVLKRGHYFTDRRDNEVIVSEAFASAHSLMPGLWSEARLTTPCDTQGDAIELPDSGLVVTSRLASILHVQPGDSVTIVPVKGERRPVTGTISKVADSYLGLAAYAELRYLSRLVWEDIVMTGAQVTTDGRPENLRRLYSELKQMPGVRSVVARRDTVENLRKTLMDSQWVFVGALIVFAGVIFFGSVVNASMVNLAERQREVATFLALGYDQWQIGGMFLRESMATNMVGTVLGLPVGYLLTLATASAYDSDLLRLPIVGPPWVWWTTVALSVLFALLAHIAVQWQIRRFDIVAALNVKE